MAHPRDGACQLVEALRHPQKWTNRNRPASQAPRGALGPQTALRRAALSRRPHGEPVRAAGGRRGQVFQPAFDGATRKPGDFRYRDEAAPSRCTSLARGEQTPPGLIPASSRPYPTAAESIVYRSCDPGRGPNGLRESKNREPRRRSLQYDLLIVAGVLTPSIVFRRSVPTAS